MGQRRLISSWLLAGCLLLASLPLSAGQRVVSLAPFLTDMVVLLGRSERLVGVLDDGSLPAELAHASRVGSHQSLPLERILATRPDLILAWNSGNPPALLLQLEQLGLRVERFDPQSLVDIAELTRDLGQLLDAEPLAERLIADYEMGLQSLFRPVEERAPRVFVQLWDDPLYTTSNKQLIGDALQHCGGRNIFAGLDILAPQIGRESVIAADPDLIILLADDPALAGEWLARWRQFPQMRAVRNRGLHVLDSQTLARPTPEALEGVALLCRLLSGEKMEVP